MKRHTITLGSKTTSGGEVISATSHGSINGVPIALEGDVIFCPACKMQGKIVCIGPRIPETWNDKNVALENDLCACGCSSSPSLIPSQSIKYQMPGETNGDRSNSTESLSTPSALDGRLKKFNDKYVLIDEDTGQPLANTEYGLKREDGKIEFGITDAQGHTHVLETIGRAESIQIYS